MTYTLTDDDELLIDYRAVADAPTPVNLSQHTYFDLSAGESADVLEHELLLHADFMTPVDETLIPTGEIVPVAGTPFDFTAPRRIGERIGEPHPQLLRGGGYDHNFVLGGESAPPPGGGSDTGAETVGLARAARVRDPASGRVLDIFTSEAGHPVLFGQLPRRERRRQGRARLRPPVRLLSSKPSTTRTRRTSPVSPTPSFVRARNTAPARSGASRWIPRGRSPDRPL